MMMKMVLTIMIRAMDVTLTTIAIVSDGNDNVKNDTDNDGKKDDHHYFYY